MPWRPLPRRSTIRRCSRSSLNPPSRRPESRAVVKRSGFSSRARSISVRAGLVAASWRPCPVDELELGGRVDDEPDPRGPPPADQRDVEWLHEPEAVEAVHGRGRRPRDPTGLPEIEAEGEQLGEGAGALQRRAEGVVADSFEDAALDSASKLAIVQSGVLRLDTGERSQLTCRSRRHTAIGMGHAGHPTRRVSRWSFRRSAGTRRCDQCPDRNDGPRRQGT